MPEDPYRDELLVELYDDDNAARADLEYYLALADAIGARKIADLGCGTGLLTRALATPGRDVYGVDPSVTMLGFAGRQPGADRVTWMAGDSMALRRVGSDADLIVSSGNAMMHISPQVYPQVLDAIRATLRPGGVVTFDSRNPVPRVWEQWTPAGTYAERDTFFGHLREWLEVTSVSGGRVEFDAHNVFGDGREAVYTSILHFRSENDIASDLERAGFTDIAVDGGWQGESVAAASSSLVFRATTPSASSR